MLLRSPITSRALDPQLASARIGGVTGGIALLPEPVKKIPHRDVVFRPISPAVVTAFWVAWREENESPALKAYVDVVAEFDRRMRSPGRGAAKGITRSNGNAA